MTKGLGGECTDTQCHRQSPKGQRISDMALIGPFKNSASMAIGCAKLHCSVWDSPKRTLQKGAQIVSNAVQSLESSNNQDMQRYQYVTHTIAKAN